MTSTNSPARYPAEVFWSDEDEGFIALAKDLPGCSAWGTDQAEALRELHNAIDAWIEAAKAAGNTIPAPSRPAETQRASGKFVLRVPRTLHSQLARRAKEENVSLNQYAVFLLTREVTVRDTTTTKGHATVEAVYIRSLVYSRRASTFGGAVSRAGAAAGCDFAFFDQAEQKPGFLLITSHCNELVRHG